MYLKVRSRQAGAYVEVAVFAGVDRDHLQYAGALNFRPDEWLELQCFVGPFPPFEHDLGEGLLQITVDPAAEFNREAYEAIGAELAKGTEP